MLANFVCLAVVGEVNKEKSSIYKVFKNKYIKNKRKHLIFKIEHVK